MKSISEILKSVDPNRFTETTSLTLCSDHINDQKVVCLDLCYDASDKLPACEVENLMELPFSDKAIQKAHFLLQHLAMKYQLPVRDEVSQDWLERINYIPCVYVSVWDNDKYELSFPAKYDPATHKIFDIQLDTEDLAGCDVLCGEFMVLQGNRFFLGEPSADGSIPVGDPYKATEEKTAAAFSQNQSLTDKIASASARSGSASEPKHKKDPQHAR